VRLKYAGIKADLVENAQDFLAQACASAPDAPFFIIANYTALPQNTYESMQTRDASKEQLNEVYSHYNAFRKNSGLYLVDTQIMMTNMMAFKNKISRKD